MCIEQLFDDSCFHTYMAAHIPIPIAKANAINRDGNRLSMESGRAREAVIKAVFYDWSSDPMLVVNNVPEVKNYDTWFYFRPVQIKTLTLSEATRWSSIKINWASGKDNGIQFRKNFKVDVDYLVMAIDNYRSAMRFYYIPCSAQRSILKQGKKKYLQSFAKDGKGTAITRQAGKRLLSHQDTCCFQIPWNESECQKVLGFTNRAEYWRNQHEKLKAHHNREKS